MTSAEEVRAAQNRIGKNGRITPLLSSPFLNNIAGRRVWIKAECLQHTGSFKFRGGWSSISALTPDQRAKGVLTYSSGNHAQGVAHAAQSMGVPCTIVMPHDAPAVKIENTKRMGATVVIYERGVEDREEVARRVDPDGKMTLIKPYDNPYVIAGQGTCGLELVQQLADAGVDKAAADVLVCCGGGGLSSGLALVFEADAPHLRVRPVEPEGFDDVTRSLKSGTRETNPRQGGSICDAILTPSPGELTFPIMHRLCGPGIVVTEEECLRAVAQAFERLRIVVEPGGAASLAAALYHKDEVKGEDVVVVVTGGNVDPEVFKRALETL